MNETLTHHFVDDQALPDLDGVGPWDLAMDDFRRHFQVLCMKVYTDRDGRRMTYRMGGWKNVDQYLQMARMVILAHNLPLEVIRHRWAVGEVVFEDSLIITYRPR